MDTKEAINVTALADELAATASAAPAGRAAHKISGGPNTELTQTVIALSAGKRLDEHANPGEATVFVLRGATELGTAEKSWVSRAGDMIEVPQERHYLAALEDSVVILTSVKQRSARHEV